MPDIDDYDRIGLRAERIATILRLALSSLDCHEHIYPGLGEDSAKSLTTVIQSALHEVHEIDLLIVGDLYPADEHAHS